MMPKTPPDTSVLIKPVESPVICRPYYEPTHYWDYDRATGRANKRDGRRPAAYWYKFADADTRRGQHMLPRLVAGLSPHQASDQRVTAQMFRLKAEVS